MTTAFHEFGAFRFFPAARELHRAGERVPTPRRTIECIGHLIAHRDRAVGRDELAVAIFRRHNVSDAQLGQIVLRARRVVGDDGHAQRVIRTIPGYGYRWVAELTTLEPDQAIVDCDPLAATESSARTLPLANLQRRDKRSALPSRRRSLALAFAMALVGLVFIALTKQHASAPSVAANSSIVVLPLRVDGLREDAWIPLGLMDLVADRLRETGLAVPPNENVLSLARSGAMAPGAGAGADGDNDVTRRVREATGARLVISGAAKRGVAGWTVELRAVPAQGMAVPAQFSDRDALAAARGAADLLLAALGRTPRDHEGASALEDTLRRARAAMLANELDTARAILATSPALAKSPAQLDYRLAQVDVRAGALDHAEAALDAVLARGDSQRDAPLRAEVLTARGATRVRRGKFADAGRDFEAALVLLGPDGNALDRGQALLGRGNSQVAAHRFGAALDDFGAARVALESAGDALGVARVDANLGMLELYRGRPADAQGYLGAAADRFQSFGALHELLLTLTGMIDAQLSLLQRDAAWASVERGWALRERITDPDQRIDLLLNRAEVLLGFGRYREAEAVLSPVRRELPTGNGVLTARARSLLAESASRRRRWQDAADITAIALAEWPAAGADADRARTLLLRQRALLALGRDVDAEALLDRARALPATPSAAPGEVAEALAMGEWLVHAGDTAAAVRWFDFAAASADQRGVPAEIVAVAVAAAPALLAAGEMAKANTSVGRVAPWAAHDFDCALLALALFHRIGPREAWFNALRQAQALAGEREIPANLQDAPPEARAPRLEAAAASASREGIVAGSAPADRDSR